MTNNAAGNEADGNQTGGNQAQNAVSPPEPLPRVPKTHKPELIEKLKNMCLTNKLILNKEIEAKNAARELKTLNHIRDPQNFPVAGSEEASLLTLDPADKEKLKVPSFFNTVSDYVYTSLARWLAESGAGDSRDDTGKVKRKAEEKSAEAEELHVNKRRCVDGSLMVPRPRGRATPMNYPQIMFDTENHAPTPLTFHLNKNLRTITEEAATLPMVKANPLPGESKGMYILDIAKLKTRFGEDSTLTCSQWIEAAENAFRFQQQRDKDGDDGPHARFYESHFSFFNDQLKRDELFPAWAPLELELRLAHVTNNEFFDIELYERHFGMCEETYKVLQKVAEMSKAKPGYRDNGGAEASGYSRPSFRRPFDRNRANQPFPSGSGRPSSTSTCLICAERGHSSQFHLDSPTPAKFTDGKPAWAKYSVSGLNSPDGRRLCAGWNVRGDKAICNHRDNSGHQCSFCGSKNHHAFSWSCRANPVGN